MDIIEAELLIKNQVTIETVIVTVIIIETIQTLKQTLELMIETMSEQRLELTRMENGSKQRLE